MYIFITILIILVCILLIFIVLAQNPKGSGGGLGATFGLGNQVMGVRRTADFMEKATWTLAIALLLMSLLSAVFVPRENLLQPTRSELEDIVPTQDLPSVPQFPGNDAPAPAAPAPGTAPNQNQEPELP